MFAELLMAFIFFIGIIYVLSLFGFHDIYLKLYISSSLTPFWKSILFSTTSISLLITELPFTNFHWYEVNLGMLFIFWILPALPFGYFVKRSKTSFIVLLIENIILAYLYTLMIQQYFSYDWHLLENIQQSNLIISIYLRASLIGIISGASAILGSYIYKYNQNRNHISENYDLSPIQRRCPYCGALVRSSALICASCGNDLSPDES